MIEKIFGHVEALRKSNHAISLLLSASPKFVSPKPNAALHTALIGNDRDIRRQFEADLRGVAAADVKMIEVS
jgi:hypothetical protein